MAYSFWLSSAVCFCRCFPVFGFPIFVCALYFGLFWISSLRTCNYCLSLCHILRCWFFFVRSLFDEFESLDLLIVNVGLGWLWFGFVQWTYFFGKLTKKSVFSFSVCTSKAHWANAIGRKTCNVSMGGGGGDGDGEWYSIPFLICFLFQQQELEFSSEMCIMRSNNSRIRINAVPIQRSTHKHTHTSILTGTSIVNCDHIKYTYIIWFHSNSDKAKKKKKRKHKIKMQNSEWIDLKIRAYRSNSGSSCERQQRHKTINVCEYRQSNRERKSSTQSDVHVERFQYIGCV